MLMLCLYMGQTVAAPTFDQAYLNWKAEQEAEDRRLQQLSAPQLSATQPNTPASQTSSPSTSSTPVQARTHPVVQVSAGQVHLNSANIEQLQQLKGIGVKKAQAIVEYRQQHGPFKQIEELKNVKGIGEGTFDKNRAQLSL